MYQMKKGGSSKSPKQQAAIAISMKKAGKKPKMSKGGSFPDLTGDGKVTKADVLKGRGVFKKGGSIKKYQDGGDKKPGRVEYNPGTRHGTRLSMDTTGYSAGRQRFPVEATYSEKNRGLFGDGKNYSMVSRKTADNIIKQQQAKDAGQPSQFPSYIRRGKKEAERLMTTPKQKMGGSTKMKKGGIVKKSKKK